MMIMGVIPARSGSKGLINKNMLQINGFSLIAWVSTQLAKNTRIEKKIITTDSDLYGQEAITHGVSYEYKRDENLSSDEASIFNVMEDIFRRYQECDYVVLLQPTQPFVTQSTLDRVLDVILQEQPTSVITSYFLNGSSHPSWAFEEDSHGHVKWCDHENHFKRRQDLPALKRRAGSVYAFSRSAISNYCNYGVSPYGNKVRSIGVGEIEAISIDTEFDYLWAKTIAEYKKIKLGL